MGVGIDAYRTVQHLLVPTIFKNKKIIGTGTGTCIIDTDTVPRLPKNRYSYLDMSVELFSCGTNS